MIHPEFLLLVLAAGLLPASRARSLAVGAAIACGLALATILAGPAVPVATLPPGFVAVQAALLAASAALAIGSALSSPRSVRTVATVAGSAAAAGGGLGVALRAVPYVVAAPTSELLAGILVIAALAGLLVAAGRLSRAAPWKQREPLPPIGVAAIGLGALLGASSSTTGGVFLGVLLAAIGGWLVNRNPAVRSLPLVPAVVLLLLLPAWWLMATIAGPEGLGTGALPNLPWSPAAERLLAPVLLTAAWSMSGLWPLHRQVPAALTAPVAALLVVRVAIPAVPDGLGHWRALAMPVVLLGLWHATFTRHRAEAVVALAWVGLVTVTSAGQAGGGLLLLGGLVLELAERTTIRTTGVAPVLRVGAALLLGSGAVLAMEGGLRTEVVYTVVAAAALAAAAEWTGSAQASTASAPTATAPSA